MKDIVSLTRSLIRCPSRYGEEGAVVSLILEQMSSLGFDRVWRDENGSAVGVIETGRPGPTLLLDGHCDTVGIAPGVAWTHDPFGGEVEGGFIYGRGAADMKAALAAMIHAAAGVDRSRLRGRVTYDRRLLAGDTADGVLEAITGLPELAGIELHVGIAQGEHTTYTGALLTGAKFLPAWAFAETHPFVQAALAGLRAAGLNPAVGAYRFCTNAAYSAGVAGAPTVGFGPGREEDAHVVDERVAVEDVLAAERGYRGIIEAVLG